MAFSSSEGKEFFRDWVNHVAKPLQFKKFFDVGCGAGWYGKILRDVFGQEISIEAIDIFPEYVTRYELNKTYDLIYIGDVVKACEDVKQFDLITAGDVLEHLTKEDAIKVVNTLRKKCRFMWCALPIRMGRSWSTGYNQGSDEWQENPANKHLHDWDGNELIQEMKPLWLVPFIQTGTFLIEGDIR